MEPIRKTSYFNGKQRVYYECPVCNRTLDIFLDGNVHRECRVKLPVDNVSVDKVKEIE